MITAMNSLEDARRGKKQNQRNERRQDTADQSINSKNTPTKKCLLIGMFTTRGNGLKFHSIDLRHSKTFYKNLYGWTGIDSEFR